MPASWKSWLRSLHRTIAPRPRRRAPVRSRPASYTPRLEAMEARDLPSSTPQSLVLYALQDTGPARLYGYEFSQDPVTRQLQYVSRWHEGATGLTAADDSEDLAFIGGDSPFSARMYVANHHTRAEFGNQVVSGIFSAAIDPANPLDRSPATSLDLGGETLTSSFWRGSHKVTALAWDAASGALWGGTRSSKRLVEIDTSTDRITDAGAFAVVDAVNPTINYRFLGAMTRNTDGYLYAIVSDEPRTHTALVVWRDPLTGADTFLPGTGTTITAYVLYQLGADKYEGLTHTPDGDLLLSRTEPGREGLFQVRLVGEGPGRQVDGVPVEIVGANNWGDFEGIDLFFNQAPITYAQERWTGENEAVAIDLNPTDPDGHRLTRWEPAGPLVLRHTRRWTTPERPASEDPGPDERIWNRGARIDKN